MKRLQSDRILLRPLLLGDAAFILELVNSANWLKFIGERKVNSLTEARAYIRKFKNNDKAQYWVIEKLADAIPVGVITWLKRDYLAHPDIGFAVLPAYEGKGYAKAGAELRLQQASTTVDAIVMPENNRSVALLKKLGFIFVEQLTIEGKALDAYQLVRAKE